MAGGNPSVKQELADLRAVRREKERTLYQERKESGLCTRCGVPAPDGDQLCETHRRYAKAATATSIRRLRAKRRRAKRCISCGRSSKRAQCLACLVKLGRVPKRDRLGGNPSVNQTRVDKDGRTRFHGTGKRGREYIHDQDIRDLKDAIASATRALEGAQAYAALPDGVRREERRAVMMAYQSQAHLAERFLEEVTTRSKYEATAERERERAEDQRVRAVMRAK